VFLFL